MQLMDVKDLLIAMNWKSSSAFFKYYLTITSRTLQPVSLPGGPLASVEDVDESVPGTSGVTTN